MADPGDNASKKPYSLRPRGGDKGGTGADKDQTTDKGSSKPKPKPKDTPKPTPTPKPPSGRFKPGYGDFCDRSDYPESNMYLIHFGKKEVEDAIEGITEQKYNEKLSLEDEDLDAWERNVKEAEKRSGHKTQKFHYTQHARTMTHREPIPDKTKFPTWYKDLKPPMAKLCGCYDYVEYTALTDYLRYNANRFLVPTRTFGNCLVEALRCQIQVRSPTFTDNTYYPNRYMKRFIAMALVQHREAVLAKYGLYLRATYGLGQDDFSLGPLTYKEYVREMFRNYSWMDVPALYAFALATNTCIVVVYSRSLTQEGIPADVKMLDADLVVVYNGKDHWTGTVEMDLSGTEKHGYFVTQELEENNAEKIKSAHRKKNKDDTESEGQSTDEEQADADEVEVGRIRRKNKRSTGVPQPKPGTSEGAKQTEGGVKEGEVAVKRKRIKKLLQSERELKKGLQKLLEEGNDDDDDEEVEEIDDDDEEEDEEEEEDRPRRKKPKRLESLPRIEKGQTVCSICQHKCAHEYNLKKHMMTHAGSALYHCKLCERGFNDKKALEKHEGQCEEYICKEKKRDRSGKIVLNKDTQKPVICGRKLYTKQGISQHKKAHRDWKAKDDGSYVAPVRKYICTFRRRVEVDPDNVVEEQCGAEYLTAKNLHDHELYCEYNENRHGPFYCPEPACDRSESMKGKPFSRPKDLNSHIRKYHGNLQSYQTYKKQKAGGGNGGSGGTGKAGGRGGKAKGSKK